MSDHQSVLVLAKPGQLLEGLQILLWATPLVEYLGCLVDGEFLNKMNQDQLPDVLLIDDAILEEEIHNTLGKISDLWPGSRIIVLAEDVERERIIGSIESVEALLKGSSAGQLFKAIFGCGKTGFEGGERIE